MEQIITAEMFRVAASYDLVMTVLILGFVLLVVFMFCRAMKKAQETRKSQDYRKLLTDLYVAGTMRKFAKEDGIDFGEEEKNFEKWLKKGRLKELTLDGTIEEDLQERLSQENQKKLDKKKKPKE